MGSIYKMAYPAVRHYQMPYQVTSHLKQMTTGQFKLLHLIHAEAQNQSRSDIKLTATEINEQTGIHKTDIGKARNGLIELGFIIADSKPTGCTYFICDPATRKVIPDKHTVEKIDFNNQPPDIMEAYIRDIVSNCEVKGKGIRGSCPLPEHRDHSPSFNFNTSAGTWKCFACQLSGNLVELERQMGSADPGGPVDAAEAYQRVVRRFKRIGASSAKVRKSVDIAFSYTDVDGEVLYEIVRANGLKSKTLARRPDPAKPGRYVPNIDGCEQVLYRLPQIGWANTVAVTEGEPDCDRVRALQLIDATGKIVAATTKAFGVGPWLPQFSEALRGKRVILLGDTDEPGIKNMESIESCLRDAGIENIINIRLPVPYRDVSHYLEHHHQSDLVKLIGGSWLEQEDVIEY